MVLQLKVETSLSQQWPCVLLGLVIIAHSSEEGRLRLTPVLVNAIDVADLFPCTRLWGRSATPAHRLCILPDYLCVPSTMYLSKRNGLLQSWELCQKPSCVQTWMDSYSGRGARLSARERLIMQVTTMQLQSCRGISSFDTFQEGIGRFFSFLRRNGSLQYKIWVLILTDLKLAVIPKTAKPAN